MNLSHLWKFMLLTVTLWLAFAVASPAQQTPDCNDACNTTGVTSCGTTSTACQVTIDAQGNASPAKVCVVAGNKIEWALATGVTGSCTVMFVSASSHFRRPRRIPAGPQEWPSVSLVATPTAATHTPSLTPLRG